MADSQLFEHLQEKLKGEVHTGTTTRLLYATDASVYKVLPRAVIYPKDEKDCIELVHFANENGLSLIPRTAGTSIAGQVVGKGIVIDFSKYFTAIGKLDKKEKWIKVQPGVILDELNAYLKKYGLFFGPETSTSSRCMIGGMMGNNSCGSHSLIYGSMREHVLEAKAILSEGSRVVFKPLTKTEFYEKIKTENPLEAKLYQQISDILGNKENKKDILRNFPEPGIKRRNTGYALDALLACNIFDNENEKFNFCKLLCGAEGTLALTTEIKLNLVNAPPENRAVICAHFKSLEDALFANRHIAQFRPHAVELMDNTIIELAKNNPLQRKNSAFLEGNPTAILFIEYAHTSKKILEETLQKIVGTLQKKKLGYAFPIIQKNDEIEKIWAFRKAGLGVLFNIAGDAKPVAFIEDTAVTVESLPDYITDLNKIFEKYRVRSVYYAHAGAGELHVRPVLNLKKTNDRKKFRDIAVETAGLVKKYGGALSGEHGDGRLRGEFISFMLSPKVYTLFLQIKNTWDPKHIFNPGKIVNALPMDENLRYENDQQTLGFQTFLDFSKEKGLLRAVENCNGTADCRNTALTGNVMCPSYQANNIEYNSTRARANVLREFLTQEQEAAFSNRELFNILALCISCKACKSECPSNIDMAKLKAEFLQHFYEKKGIPFRTSMIAHFPQFMKWFSSFPGVYNFFGNSKLAKKMLGVDISRKLPQLDAITVAKWRKKRKLPLGSKNKMKLVLLLDEFSNYTETQIGIAVIQLFEKMGYQVDVESVISGRTYFSKGLLKKAKQLAERNIIRLSPQISKNSPLVGIEPSALFCFRDEYPDIVGNDVRERAAKIASCSFTFEEFFAKEIEKGNIVKEQFTDKILEIKIHAHCYQKALSSAEKITQILSFPTNYNAELMDTGCCGMAGSFGYEKQHSRISKTIAGLKLLPAIKSISDNTVIVAPGTSCRHQIAGLSSRKAQHPAEVLLDALKKNYQLKINF